jgi:hypothetical protein
MNDPSPTTENAHPVEVGREVYEAPRLLALGDVRDLTLGGSPGTGDSGNASLQQF